MARTDFSLFSLYADTSQSTLMLYVIYRNVLYVCKLLYGLYGKIIHALPGLRYLPYRYTATACICKYMLKAAYSVTINIFRKFLFSF